MIWEFGSGPGCAFWLMREPMGGGKVRYHLTFRPHLEHVQGWVLAQAACRMLSRKLRAVPMLVGN